MRPDRHRPRGLRQGTHRQGFATRGTAVWPCPSRMSQGHQGPGKSEWPLWLPFMHFCFFCAAVGSFS